MLLGKRGGKEGGGKGEKKGGRNWAATCSCLPVTPVTFRITLSNRVRRGGEKRGKGVVCSLARKRGIAQ